MKALIGRLVRYGLVGVVINVAGYLMYLLITWLGLGPKTTMSLLYGTGIALGYNGNRRFAFSYEGNYSASLVRYLFAHLCGYGLNFGLLHVFVDHLGYPHQIVQAIAIGIVAAFLFLSLNTFVFPRASDRRP